MKWPRVAVETPNGTSSSWTERRQEALGNVEGEEDYLSLGFLWLEVTRDK